MATGLESESSNAEPDKQLQALSHYENKIALCLIEVDSYLVRSSSNYNSHRCVTASISPKSMATSTCASKGKGATVVKEVVDTINSLGIFPNDHKFLCRVAWVESKYGEASGTYRSGYHGGIWQVELFRLFSVCIFL